MGVERVEREFLVWGPWSSITLGPDPSQGPGGGMQTAYTAPKGVDRIGKGLPFPRRPFHSPPCPTPHSAQQATATSLTHEFGEKKVVRFSSTPLGLVEMANLAMCVPSSALSNIGGEAEQAAQLVKVSLPHPRPPTGC